MFLREGLHFQNLFWITLIYQNILIIGTKLIDEITGIYSSRGIKSISLSVNKRNRAKLLYTRKGFIAVADKDTAVTMKKNLR